jgi:hypothetical protein
MNLHFGATLQTISWINWVHFEIKFGIECEEIQYALPYIIYTNYLKIQLILALVYDVGCPMIGVRSSSWTSRGSIALYSREERRSLSFRYVLFLSILNSGRYTKYRNPGILSFIYFKNSEPSHWRLMGLTRHSVSLTDAELQTWFQLNVFEVI